MPEESLFVRGKVPKHAIALNKLNKYIKLSVNRSLADLDQVKKKKKNQLCKSLALKATTLLCWRLIST